MLINFCQDNLQTTITSNVISTEGYEVTNLLKNSDKGFLAYSAIKPPVNVDITFSCWIKISRIIIWPSVGAQKSSGFRLSSRSTSNNDYSQICLGFLTEKNENGLLFYRRNCDDDNFSIPSNFYSLIINNGIIDRVKSLRIGIIKTNNSVPAIGKIQVWGEISSFNNPKVYKNIIQLLANKSNKNQHDKSNDIINKTKNNVENEIQKSERNLTNGLNIPDEFLDPITCTIMQQPVVLPSGKIIDQSTLENYEKSEANWGRKLNDPFTGVPFTDTNKPIFSPTIKARIDKFLTANCDADEIKALPRLLGQSVELKRKNSEEISTTVLKLQKTNSFDKLDDCFVKNQENKLTYNPSSPSSSTSTSTSKQIKVDVNSPIDDDLEENLKTVLSGLKRFTDKKVDNDCDNTKNNINCLCCENGIYYKFPCHHIICRKSLLSNRNFKCPNCSKIFSSNDLEKINK